VTPRANWGRSASLVNNAGISPVKPFLTRITAEDWDEDDSGQSRLGLPRHPSGAAWTAPAASGDGSIIMSSVAAQDRRRRRPALRGQPRPGLIGLAHSYAALLAKEGITSNADRSRR